MKRATGSVACVSSFSIISETVFQSPFRRASSVDGVMAKLLGALRARSRSEKITTDRIKVNLFIFLPPFPAHKEIIIADFFLAYFTKEA
jgi:hypothetical protein